MLGKHRSHELRKYVKFNFCDNEVVTKTKWGKNGVGKNGVGKKTNYM